ncbi:MAG: 3-phosphoshikimate 1-carboxyvinyltransferase [Flavobacterium sp.]
MNLHLQLSSLTGKATIQVSGSKSETNRLLLLQALYPNIILENTSNSDDSEVMLKALSSDEAVIDIHHAGTAMRFLTAYFSIQEGRTVTLTGSSRMKERPIKILVDALRQLGAEIEYKENEGFPPIKITGKKLVQNKVTLKADVSSQYISALLLIAPKLEHGLELTLDGIITSIPYIKMTLALLNEIGIETPFKENKIIVFPQFEIHNSKFTIESDWSSASYFYSIVALAEENTEITLSSYKENGFQGDSALAGIYKNFGVETIFENHSIVLRKSNHLKLETLNLGLNETPDLAQTITVTCFGLGIGCHLTGLHTLKIKETDRLEALKNELSKLGAKVSITNDSLTLESSNSVNSNIKIATYNDHRMAMAFAPLAIKVPIEIENAEVVSKSYPDFWKDLKTVGFEISEQK